MSVSKSSCTCIYNVLIYMYVCELCNYMYVLQNCISLSVQPVVCSDLEDLKEASKMATLPFPPPLTSSDCQDASSHTFTCHSSPTQSNKTESEQKQVLEKSSDVSVSSATSGCSSTSSREPPSDQINVKNTPGKKPMK